MGVSKALRTAVLFIVAHCSERQRPGDAHWGLPALASQLQHMFSYSVFGGSLRSAIAFPELTARDATSGDWTLSRVEVLETARSPELLGQLEVQPGTSVRLFRHQHGYRVEFDDTGEFDVSAGGRLIRWRPGSQHSLDIARFDILGAVLATALHASGMLCLHGSGVVIGDEAVGFVAPKFHGKSTLAAALTAAGGYLLSDDALPVECGSPAYARPGLHGVRLWADSFSRLAGTLVARGIGPDSKGTFGMSTDRLVSDRVPLGAVYVLSPVRVENTQPAVRRSRLGGAASAIALVSHTKAGTLFGGSEAATVLRRAADLSRTVPVYSLEVARDFERLPAVVQQLLEWHA